MTTTLACANRKGGVGKTTVSVNLAAGLALKGHRVLLVDLDPQAHATGSLGVEPYSLLPECFMGRMSTSEAIVQTTIEQLTLLPASDELRDLNRTFASGNYKHRLNLMLHGLAGYDFILIDCPLLESLLENALVAADWLIMPVQLQYLSMSGAQQMLRLLSEIQQDTGQCAQLLGLVLSQVNFRLRSSHRHAKTLRTHFGSQVFDTVIPVYAALEEATNYGESIYTHAPKSRAAIVFKELTQELLRRLE